MSASPGRVLLAVALEGTGWHPASWRIPGARPGEVSTAGYWEDLVGTADRGGIDLVTFEDGFSLQSARRRPPDGRTDRLRGRLDAVLVAARVAPATRRVGLVPLVTVTHTEPFHLSKAIATLDWVSGGRAGVQVKVAGAAHEAAHFGRRDLAGDDLFAEAADWVEVARRLWDSWEDDAEIRDADTGRFVDRDKLHTVDFEGRWFSVRGPSITPRPPQGQPVVAALAHRGDAIRLAADSCDVVFVTPLADDAVAPLVAEVRAAEAAVGRTGPPLRVLADVVVFVDDDPAEAVDRRRRLDDAGAWTTEAAMFTGSPADLADLVAGWHAAGVDGVRLRPACVPHDLDGIVTGLVPELTRRGLLPAEPHGGSLRARLGLPRPPNRYAGMQA